LDVAWRRVEAVIGNELRIMVLKVMVRVLMSAYSCEWVLVSMCM
jgi:hypothetical protein